jgi:hypothetical protein
MTQRLMDGLDVGLGDRGLHECFRLLAVIDVREYSNGNRWKKEEFLRQAVSSLRRASLAIQDDPCGS